MRRPRTQRRGGLSRPETDERTACLDHRARGLLDYEGAEFLLIGARTDPERVYDIDLPAQEESYDRAEVIRELKMVKLRHPVEPLFEGKWA